MKCPPPSDSGPDDYDDSPWTQEELNALVWELIERGRWEWEDDEEASPSISPASQAKTHAEG